MWPHHLTYSEMQRYYQNKSKSNGVFSRDNLPEIKDRAYVINLDEYKSIRNNGLALYVNNGENVTL